MTKNNNWTLWKNENPSPGMYVYVRDIETVNEWEVGYVVGEEGDSRALVANDPSMSQIECDEWKNVPLPSESWHDGNPPPETFVFVRNLDMKEKWEIGFVVGREGDSRVELMNVSGPARKYEEWQPVPPPAD